MIDCVNGRKKPNTPLTDESPPETVMMETKNFLMRHAWVKNR